MINGHRDKIKNKGIIKLTTLDAYLFLVIVVSENKTSKKVRTNRILLRTLDNDVND
tara:strand:- start:616 stop:783 length:168 start_codon:yes stop_codon:yes gene_type:complete